MNTGIIAQRYAKALLLLVQESGRGEAVVVQTRKLLHAMENVPELCRTLYDPAVSDSLRSSIFSSALAPDPVEPDLDKFLALVMKKGRVEMIKYIFISFDVLWCRYKGIFRGILIVPKRTSATAELERKLKDVVKSHFGKTLELEVQEKPELIGGFVLDIEDRLLDASAKHQLDIIRKQFRERNRRIV
jgi:F-type H+-transporting ATPase subunit delta